MGSLLFFNKSMQTTPLNKNSEKYDTQMTKSENLNSWLKQISPSQPRYANEFQHIAHLENGLQCTFVPRL